MKAKEIVWGSWEVCDNFKYCYGLVGQFTAYTLYEEADYYWVSNGVGSDSISTIEFHSLDEAKAKCEEDLERYVDWLQKQLHWLGGEQE